MVATGRPLPAPAPPPRRAALARRVILAGSAVAALEVLAILALLWLVPRRSGGAAGHTPPALQGALGDTVRAFDQRYALAGAPASGPEATERPYRRVYGVLEGRVVAEVLPDGRIRQLTVGRDRNAQDAWQPADSDWSLEQARAIARRWLPADAGTLRSEPFSFQERPAGTRDVYRSAALGGVFGPADYAEMRASGPPGIFAATYYQTTAGGVAFILIGLV